MGKRMRHEEAQAEPDVAAGDHVMDALCAAAGVTANEVLGQRAYADHVVVVVADGRKLQVPLTFVRQCARQARQAEGATPEARR